MAGILDLLNPRRTSAADPEPAVVLSAPLAESEKAIRDSIQAAKFERPIEESFGYISLFANTTQACPPYGYPERDVYLSRIWRDEPILAGALYAMIAKAGAWDWNLTGGRNAVTRGHVLLSEADAGRGWTHFIQTFAQDLLTLDRGAFAELVRSDGEAGPVTDFMAFDGLRCRTTGNAAFPVIWRDDKGIWLPVPDAQCVHQVLNPSPRDADKGIGFSPVSRALQAATILMALNRYDAEKLSNMPPEGVAAISGLSLAQVQSAFKLWRSNRQNRSEAVFPGVLWLVGNQEVGGVRVDFTSFSQMPEQFDRKIVTETYVKTVALAFGVDVAEFWQVEFSGATKASVTVQHQKALGKGQGDMAQGIERWMNWSVLPAAVTFAFDQKDAADDLEKAGIAQAAVDYISKLYATPTGMLEGLVDRDEARRLLAQSGVLPSDMVQINEVVQDDTEKMMRKIAWERGEDIVTADRGGRIVHVWSAAKQFAGVYLPVVRDGMLLGRSKATASVPEGGLAQEITALPMWRRVDIAEWQTNLNNLSQAFEDDVDASARRWIADGKEHPVEVEPGVSL